MAKPVVVEVNNKCSCHWNAGNTISLSNQHPAGNAPSAAFSFNCRVLDDRGLYLYVDSRPSGYRFWCTHCKNNDPMNFSYFTEQQTEFVAGMMRRFSLVEDTKKKLDKKIQDLNDTLDDERETFSRTLSEEQETSEKTLQEALEEAHARDVYFKGKEEQWTKEDTERREYERKKRTGLALIPHIGKFDFDGCCHDGLGEVTRDFMRACEDMTRLVRALLFVQNTISACQDQEERMNNKNPMPCFDKRNEIFLHCLKIVLGTEPEQNSVPLLPNQNACTGNSLSAKFPPPSTIVLDVGNSIADEENNDDDGTNANNNNEKQLSPTGSTHDRTSQRGDGNISARGGGSKSQKEKEKEKEREKEREKENALNRPVVHIPFDFLAHNSATQNYRRLPKSNFRLCPNHDVCSSESSCAYFHLKTVKVKFARVGELSVPAVFVRDRNDLQTHFRPGQPAPDGCIDTNCHCKTKVHLHPCSKILLFPTWTERDDIWQFIVTITECDEMNENLENLKKEKMRFERFLGRHPNILNSKNSSKKKKEITANENAAGSNNENASAAAASSSPKDSHSNDIEQQDQENNNKKEENVEEGGATATTTIIVGDENENEQEQNEEDDSYFPDGSIAALETTVKNCFAKARLNMNLEFDRNREMHILLTTFDFHFLQLREYSAQMHQFFRVTRDLDNVMKHITDTSLHCGELVRQPKPGLDQEARAFAVGVALVIRETEQTFEDLLQLRDRIEFYKDHIERSTKAHKIELEIEHIERQIEHKQKEVFRSRKKIELLDADLAVLADGDAEEFEAQEKKTERAKALNELQTKTKELTELQKQHHERFIFLVETRDTILPDLDLKDSEQKRWSELLGEGNDALPNSRNLVDFVKQKRSAAAAANSPGNF